VRFPFFDLERIVLGLLLLTGCGGAIHEPSKHFARANTQTGATGPQTRAGGEGSGFRFVPATYREGHRVALPVAFPDGTRAELVYPSELDLAELGATPYSSGYLRGKSPTPGRGDEVGRDFRIFYGDVHDVLAFVNGGASPALLAHYKGADGQTVGFWDVRLNETPDYLAFQFGHWAVLVYDYAGAAAMTDEERASWAASFSGRETDDGFLLLEGVGRLRLARTGEHAGPELAFGSAGELTLFPGRCTPQPKPVQRRSGFAGWCLSESMGVHATGRDGFIAALIAHLGVRDVERS
jgi:hypothetical protein